MSYFRPMRRKVGIALLALGGLFTAAWIQAETGPRHADLSLPFGIRFFAHMDADLVAVDFRIGNRIYLPCRFRHWPMSIYLSLYSTLLSAYLLLSRPRVSAKKKPAE